MRARLPRDIDPEAVQRRVIESVSVPTRDAPHVVLEELDGDEVVVRVMATPADRGQGGRLAREILNAVAAMREDDNAPTPA